MLKGQDKYYYIREYFSINSTDNMSLNLAIGIITAVFVFTYLLVNMKLITLWIIRFLYGNYSSEYVNLYKKYFVKNPFPPCIKEDIKLHCFNFIDKDPAKIVFNTNNAVVFGQFPFYTKFSTIKENITPNCFNIYKMSKKNIIKIIGRRTEILGIETKELYYFLNDIYFMGEYSFSDVSNENNEQLIGMLASKYEIDNVISNESFYIQDDRKSLISFDNNGFSITIQYINLGKSFIHETWDRYFRNITKKETSFNPELSKIMFAKL
jgi:hypothetical protein